MFANLRHRSVDAKTRGKMRHRFPESCHRPSCDPIDGAGLGSHERWTGLTRDDTIRLADLVDVLNEDGDLYHAAIDIAATLYDGTQKPERVILAVIDAISNRFF